MADENSQTPLAMLEELEQVLTNQLTLLADNDLQAMSPLVNRTAQLVAELSQLPPGSLEPASLQRVADLQRRLELALALTRQETGQTLKKLRAGRGVLKAYRL